MKKILFLGVLLSFSLLIACGDDDDPDPVLNVTDEVELDGGVDEEIVNITSNISWTAESADTWCTVNPPSGTNDGKLTIKVEANPDMKDRSTTVTVKSATIERKITVKQNPASMEALLVGDWEITDQTHEEPAFDIVVGIIFELKEDKSAVAIIERQLTPELPNIDKLEGTWELEGMKVTFASKLMENDFGITLEIKEFGTNAFEGTMTTTQPGLLPADGLPVIVERVQEEEED